MSPTDAYQPLACFTRFGVRTSSSDTLFSIIMCASAAPGNRRPGLFRSCASAFFTATTTYDRCVIGCRLRHVSPIAVRYELALQRIGVSVGHCAVQNWDVRGIAQLVVNMSGGFLPDGWQVEWLELVDVVECAGGGHGLGAHAEDVQMTEAREGMSDKRQTGVTFMLACSDYCIYITALRSGRLQAIVSMTVTVSEANPAPEMESRRHGCLPRSASHTLGNQNQPPGGTVQRIVRSSLQRTSASR